jgi:murein DD-endopeptidase MepM/ murein hydrolase activator NlpD
MRLGVSFSLHLAALLVIGCEGRAPSPLLPLQVPAGHDIVLPLETHLIESAVPRHSTLASLLLEHGLSAEHVTSIVDSTKRVFDLRRIRAGQPYKLVRSLDGFLREFEYQIDTDRFLRIASAPAAIASHFAATVAAAELPPVTPPPVRPAGDDRPVTVEVRPYEKTRSVMSVTGVIDAEHSSLISAMDRTGERAELALALADVFGGEVDFSNDLQRGDTFTLLFESFAREGRFSNYGAILAAELINDGRRLQAFRFTPPDQKPAYYDGDGRSMRRFFLRSPLKFEPRVTSGFSRRRLHPVLRTYRPHLGVDYRAPSGAPVVAVANGVVESAGWAGGAGKMVRIKHSSGYESSYLHLSAITVKRGARVTQGELVGRVGATGLATGPHLDYRLRRNGVFVNPLNEHRRLPPGEPIPSTVLGLFHAERDRMLAELAPSAQNGQAVAQLASPETP